MNQDMITNELLVYAGTLLVAATMFAFILLSFLGCLLAGLAFRGLQLTVLTLSAAVVRQWSSWRGQPADQGEARETVSGPATKSSVPSEQ